MSQNGVVDAEGIAALRKRRKRGGVHTVALSDELTVKVTLIDIVGLISQKRIPNALLKAAMNIQSNGATGMTPEKLSESLEFIDALGSAIVREPKWCPMSEAGEDAAPEGMLCLNDLTQDERDAMFALVYGGLDGLERFRRERRSAADTPTSEDVREEAERSDLPDGGGLRPVLVRPSDPGEGAGSTEESEPEAATG